MKGDLQAPAQRQITTWVNFTNLSDDVEKLIYPLREGDDYDGGHINEVHSQLYVFQGVLSFLNESSSSKKKQRVMTLPAPIEYKY